MYQDWTQEQAQRAIQEGETYEYPLGEGLFLNVRPSAYKMAWGKVRVKIAPVERAGRGERWINADTLGKRVDSSAKV